MERGRWKINTSSSAPKNQAYRRPNCNFPNQVQFWKISVSRPIKQIEQLILLIRGLEKEASRKSSMIAIAEPLAFWWGNNLSWQNIQLFNFEIGVSFRIE